MLKFTDINQLNPQKKKHLKLRSKNFDEIYLNGLLEKKAEKQSSRCSQCGIPFFVKFHCPLQNNIPDWLTTNS